MAKAKIIVLSGYGLNCEEETKHAFDIAGGFSEIVHINDLISQEKKLKNYQILAIPGGFSYGDDTGSGKAYANRMKNHLLKEMNDFLNKDKLVIGICNGFQILTNLGLLPGALTFNDSTRYTDRWVDLKITGDGPWLAGIKTLSLPIAHGEGKYYIDKKDLKNLKKSEQIAAQYFKGEISRWQNLPANPNGSLENIAAITSYAGQVLGIMPHPERAISFTHLPHWTYLKEKYAREGSPITKAGPGIKIFQNAINYFK